MQLMDITIDWTAVAALAAVAGVLLAAYHNRRTFGQQAGHNKRSVRPLLVFQTIYTHAGNDPKVGLLLRNDGVGPALLRRIRVYLGGGVEGELVIDSSNMDDAAFHDELMYNPDYPWTHSTFWGVPGSRGWNVAAYD